MQKKEKRNLGLYNVNYFLNDLLRFRNGWFQIFSEYHWGWREMQANETLKLTSMAIIRKTYSEHRWLTYKTAGRLKITEWVMEKLCSKSIYEICPKWGNQKWDKINRSCSKINATRMEIGRSFCKTKHMPIELQMNNMKSKRKQTQRRQTPK